MAGPTVTQAALKFMRRMVRFGGQGEGAGFRLRVSAGGCSGYDSSFTVEPVSFPGDQELVLEGVRLFLPAESRLMLEGVTVDFADTPTSSGLTFFNPSAEACGCSSNATGPAATPGVTRIRIDAIRKR